MTKVFLPLPATDKSLGQHFLTSENIILTICQDCNDKKVEAIIEIGPGPGILTKHLAKENIPYWVIEKDLRFKVYLEQFLNNDQIIMDDALAFNLNEFIKTKNLNNIWLVSNLPYNIATPLLVKFLKIPEIKFMTLMFQKEVADKIFPFATTRNFMNSLLVLTQTYFDCSLLVKVPPGAFAPPPKVDSAVISMIKKDSSLVDLSEFLQFEKFLRLLFSQRRKQLGGVLKSSYPITKIHEIFNELIISPSIRAEALTFQQVHQLYRKFCP